MYVWRGSRTVLRSRPGRTFKVQEVKLKPHRPDTPYHQVNSHVGEVANNNKPVALSYETPIDVFNPSPYAPNVWKRANFRLCSFDGFGANVRRSPIRSITAKARKTRCERQKKKHRQQRRLPALNAQFIFSSRLESTLFPTPVPLTTRLLSLAKKKKRKEKSLNFFTSAFFLFCVINDKWLQLQFSEWMCQRQIVENFN